MHASPADQQALLQLQTLDTQLAQIAHRRDTLPQQQSLTQAQTQLREVSKQLVAAQTERADVAREQQRSDADVEQVRARITRDEQQLRSGALGAKDLQAMEHEVVSLQRRQAELEEIELEIMQRVEDIDKHIAGLRTQQEQAQQEQAQAQHACDEAVAQLASQQHDAEQHRDAVAVAIDADLLALYERKRARTGTGAGLLRQNRCGACQVELIGVDLSQVRTAAPQEVLTHEDCGAILVRTAESGL